VWLRSAILTPSRAAAPESLAEFISASVSVLEKPENGREPHDFSKEHVSRIRRIENDVIRFVNFET